MFWLILLLVALIVCYFISYKEGMKKICITSYIMMFVVTAAIGLFLFNFMKAECVEEIQVQEILGVTQGVVSFTDDDHNKYSKRTSNIEVGESTCIKKESQVFWWFYPEDKPKIINYS